MNGFFVPRSYYIKKVLQKSQTTNLRFNGSLYILVPCLWSGSHFLSFFIFNISPVNCFKKPEAREMAQWLWALAEDLGLVFSTHIAAHKFQIWYLLLASKGIRHTLSAQTYAQEKKPLIHRKISHLYKSNLILTQKTEKLWHEEQKPTQTGWPHDLAPGSQSSDCFPDVLSTTCSCLQPHQHLTVSPL